MIDIESMFQYRTPNAEKLIASGFTLIESAYIKEIPLINHQFKMIVTIKQHCFPQFRVVESVSDEEYILVHVSDAHGEFVSKVRLECEKELIELSMKCYDLETLKAEQTKRILSHIKEVYSIEPAFLWEKSKESAAFRKVDNKKWFAVMMNVNKEKLGLSGNGSFEIIVLKDTPEHVEQLLNSGKYLSAYHMNKKHWYSACLNGTISDDELYERIAVSYALAG